jgi:hypothetical protein
MVKVGTAFQLKGDGFHLWLVASEPNNEGKVVAFNVTDRNNYPSSTCQLQVGDHAFITKPSVIRYKSPKLWAVAAIEQHIQTGTFIQHPDASQVLMSRIIQGAFASGDISPFFLSNLKPI